MKKGWIIAISVILVLAIIIGIVFFVMFGYSKKYAETKTITVGDGNTLKIGVLSDSQLPGDGKDSRWTENLKIALETFKAQEVDVLVHAGDFTDLGTVDVWKTFQRIYNEVFGENGPEKCFVMGNHDYWLGWFVECWDIPTPARQQNKFTKYTGELPYSHKVINGYHFINWSSGDGSYDKSYQNKEWVREQLDAAVADDPSKPIFVTTHINPENTFYGSDEWGNADVYDVLKDYPQVVSLSGHSHYSLLDERSLWQDGFTAVGTQSIDYIELESGKFNGTIPKDAYGNSIAKTSPMGMIITVNGNTTEIARINTKTGAQLKDTWQIQTPVSADTALYTTAKREAVNAAPAFANGFSADIVHTVDNDGNAIRVLRFTAATDDDFVHSYKLVFKDAAGEPIRFDETTYDGALKKDDEDNVKQIAELLYFSDYTKGLSNMADTAELRLPANMPENTASIDVYGIDSWGAQTAVQTVAVQ